VTSAAKSPYAGYRFPGEVISHAVWLYFRFPLSLRMVEEMLAARGIEVSHECHFSKWASAATLDLAEVRVSQRASTLIKVGCSASQSLEDGFSRHAPARFPHVEDGR